MLFRGCGSDDIRRVGNFLDSALRLGPSSKYIILREDVFFCPILREHIFSRLACAVFLDQFFPLQMSLSKVPGTKNTICTADVYSFKLDEIGLGKCGQAW